MNPSEDSTGHDFTHQGFSAFMELQVLMSAPFDLTLRIGVDCDDGDLATVDKSISFNISSREGVMALGLEL